MMTSNYWFGGAQAYQISQSLRFNSADSAYLNRTPGSAGNRRTWTWSGWVKRSKLGVDATLFHAYDGSASRRAQFGFNTSDQFVMNQGGGGTSAIGTTTAVFRDVSAWYHIVFYADYANTTFKLYINNVEQTISYSSSVINADGQINAAIAHQISSQGGSAAYFDGYLTEINFIDGSALTPSSFGETDTTTGAWIPKRYTGTYGTNGFYLKFDPAATNGIGHDHSGNGNNFTATGFTTSGTGTDVMSDTPTKNWCTFNPLANAWSNSGTGSVADGNLYLSYSSGNWFGKKGTMAVSSGKWYYEWTNTSGGTASQCGFTTIESASETGSGVYRYRSNGEKVNTSYTASYGATWSTAGDIIGIALDIDAGTIVFYKNGVSQGTAFSSIPAGTYIPECVIEGAGYTGYANFGQRAFAYTPPTGYKALNTQNLPEPTIKDGGKYFNTVLYTGNGSTQSISGVGFSPDLIWVKNRASAYAHALADSVRGATKSLSSNLTAAERTSDITSLDSDGFSLQFVNATGTYSENQNSQAYAAWCWDAGGAGSSNNSGTITSTVSANASAGFSIVSYTGNGSSNQTVGHGLGVAPAMIILKDRDSNATSNRWWVWHQKLTSGHNIYLDDTAASFAVSGTTSGGIGGSPTSTTFTLQNGASNNNNVNENGDRFVAYCFSEVASYSKFGSYVGNGSSDGPFCFCGFRPAWVLIKSSSASGESWILEDSTRDTYNPAARWLYPNYADAESNGLTIDFLSNGFKPRISGTSVNTSSATYIFAAFAELPFKYANAR